MDIPDDWEEVFPVTADPFVSIYVLIDPRDNEIKYVGQTINPRNRLYSHHRPHRRYLDHSEAMTAWLFDLKSQGLKVRMFIVERVQPQDADSTEIHWIVTLHNEGYAIFNKMHKPAPTPKKITFSHIEKQEGGFIITATTDTGESCSVNWDIHAGLQQQAGYAIKYWAQELGISNGGTQFRIYIRNRLKRYIVEAPSSFRFERPEPSVK